MFRTVIWIIASALGLIILTPFALVCMIFSNKDPMSEPPALAKWVVEVPLAWIVRLGGCDYSVSGLENIPEGPALFAGNHQGNFDVGLILSVFNGYKIPVAKIEAKKVPLANLWMMLLHIIFMDRKDVRQSAQCMELAAEHLKAGQSVVIFPEGRRSKGCRMDEFKPGAFKPALKAQTPVVPFVIDGTYKCFEEKRRLIKAPVTVTILPPVYPQEGEKTKALSQRVRQMIQDELDRHKA